jgi:hypothetical protein
MANAIALGVPARIVILGSSIQELSRAAAVKAFAKSTAV